jgi:phenylacetate-CoA ligase
VNHPSDIAVADAPGTDPPDRLDPVGIRAHQHRKLVDLLALVRQSNPFYQRKLAGVAGSALLDTAGASASAAAALPALLAALPFTTRAELQRDQADHPPYGSNLTFPLDQYSRFHQTSGTLGRPMRWLDTLDAWHWVADCWGTIFTAAGVGRGDRVLFPFSFGPFLGFWAAFDGAVRLGAMAIPAGGTSTLGRLQLIAENRVTAVCCTPTYALRLAEAAAAEGVDVGTSVRAILVAGEPGGSVPEIRRRIEAGFPGARVFDHHGMTEMGPVSFECIEARGGVHVNEAQFIPEVVNPATGEPVPDGEQGELVLTNLGRTGSPLIRYRTNDQVRLTRGRCACGRWDARLAGGILGRTDDMFTVRGNNVFPTAVEAIVRRFPEVAEFRLTVVDRGPLAEARLEVEPVAENGADAATGARPVAGGIDIADVCRRLSQAVHDELHFRAEVSAVAPGTLPRFEMKAKRFVRQR